MPGAWEPQLARAAEAPGAAAAATSVLTDLPTFSFPPAPAPLSKGKASAQSQLSPPDCIQPLAQSGGVCRAPPGSGGWGLGREQGCKWPVRLARTSPCPHKARDGRAQTERGITADARTFGKCLASLDPGFLINLMGPRISAECYRKDRRKLWGGGQHLRGGKNPVTSWFEDLWMWSLCLETRALREA